MENHPTSYLSPKFEARPKNDGCGIFARELVKKGELVAVWGGEVFATDEFMELPEKLRGLSVQVEEGLYLVSVVVSSADCFNHSCDPNIGIVGQITVFALRDIQPDEEARFDYATTDGSPYDEFECDCGTSLCRGNITGDDWKNEVLWDRYAGYIAPYLQRRIDQLRANR